MLNVNLSQFGVLFSPKRVYQNTLVEIFESLPYLLGIGGGFIYHLLFSTG